MDLRQFPTLAKLAHRHEKRLEKFQEEATKFFHPHAVTLCKRIKKGIPEFEGCQLAMRHLFLEPRDLKIPIKNYNGEEDTERLDNILEYVDSKNYEILLPAGTIEALKELDKLADYIDDNYSMVGGLEVTL